MEGCRLLAEARECEWETRHARDKKRTKGDVGIEKEKEKEKEEREN